MRYKDVEFMSLEDYIHSIYQNKIEDEYSDLIAKNEHIIVLPVRKIAFVYHSNDEDIYDNPYLLSKEYLKRGIRLVHIYQYEWVNNFRTFSRFVFSIIVRQHKKQINEFTIREADSEEFSKFIGNYHLFTNQDKGAAAVKLGMYDEGNNLIAVAGFRRNKKYGWEWKRFVIKTDVVSNGFYIPDEFFKYFNEKYIKVGEGCVDFQQLDRFPDIETYTSKRFGFVKKGLSQGYMWVSADGNRFTNYDFKSEKKGTALGIKNHPNEDWDALRCANFYGFATRIRKCGTATWVYEKTDE